MTDLRISDVPKTLIVDLSANFGGANARVFALISRFPKDRIGLATLHGSVIASDLENAGYRVHYLASRKFDVRILFRMMRVIRDHHYQVVDTQNPQSKFWGSLASFLSGIKLISTLNSWYMNEHPKYSLRWFVYSGMEFATNFALSRYIVVSREILNAMLQAGIPEGKIDLIYNAVDLNESSITGSKEWLREKYSLPGESVICLAAGRLAWAKAHDDLIDAVVQARKKNPNIYCLIAGDGELKTTLEKQIERLNANKFVLLLGHVRHDELLPILKACDVYVMPSRTEGTPVALLEAAALAKPIVASNIGGIPELVSNEEHALLFNVGNIDDLASALLRVASDTKLAYSLGTQAKNRVVAKFTVSTQFESTAESYIKSFVDQKS